jgi:hypothetical protein
MICDVCGDEWDWPFGKQVKTKECPEYVNYCNRCYNARFGESISPEEELRRTTILNGESIQFYARLSRRLLKDLGGRIDRDDVESRRLLHHITENWESVASISGRVVEAHRDIGDEWRTKTAPPEGCGNASR